MTADHKIAWSTFAPVGREQELLVDAYASGWVSGGAYVERLERELSSLFPGSEAFAVANGTAALQLAFQVLGLQPGDRVIVPSFCFQAAGNVLVQLGAIPIFCDCDPLTWNQSVETIARAHAATQAVGVVVVHNYGLAAPIAEIAAWAREQGVWVIEDCAEAWFSRYRGQLLGTFGTLATFSMHATKTISCGEGGVVLLNEPSLARRLRLLRSHGLDRAHRHYLHALAGNNYRLSNLLAAVAVAQLEGREALVQRQDENALRYLRQLEGHDLVSTQQALRDADNRIWALAVQIDFARLSIDRDDMIAELRLRGIETRPGFYPASAHDYYPAGTVIHDCVAAKVSSEVIALPCPLGVQGDEIDHIVTTLFAVIDAHRHVDAQTVIVRSGAAEFRARVGAFAEGLKEGRSTFRYFMSRSPEVIRNHATTMLVESGGRDVAYGHLDEEAGVTWLGIAVADGLTGRGWGRVVMRELITDAARLGISTLRLRVDRDNAPAQQLYRQFGFEVVEIGTDAVTMSKSVEPIEVA